MAARVRRDILRHAGNQDLANAHATFGAHVNRHKPDVALGLIDRLESQDQLI